MNLEKSFDQFIDGDYIAFSMNIIQDNKKNMWKKKLIMTKNWQKLDKNSTKYNAKSNGLALLTGKKNGIIVIDIDNLQHWNNFLIKNNKKEPKTVKANSASGGFHLYFKYSDDLEEIKSKTHCFGKEYNIDIRTNGGCIIVPPTTYYDNNTKKNLSYTWVQDKSIFDMNPANIPKWMFDLLREKNNIVCGLSQLGKNVKSSTVTAKSNIKNINIKNEKSKNIKLKITKKKDIISKDTNENNIKLNDSKKKDIKLENSILNSTKSKDNKYLDLKDDNDASKNSDINNDDNNDDLISVDHDFDIIENLLDMLSDDRIDNYDSWIMIGMIIYNETNGEGFSIWDSWSKKSSKYDKKECLKKWNSFKTSNDKNKVKLGTLIHYCKQDNEDIYKKFKIKRKNDQMIMEKFPNMNLELGETIEVNDTKCTFINNNKCVFTGKPHRDMPCSMYVDVCKDTMKIKCRHKNCTGQMCPYPSIRLTKNEMNMIYYGTVNVNNVMTINNYGSESNEIIDFPRCDIFEDDEINGLVFNSLNGGHTEIADIIYYYYKNTYNVGEDGKWYKFHNHRWKALGLKSDNFSIEVDVKIKQIYQDVISYGKEINLENFKINELKKIRKSFSCAKTKDDIMKVTKERFKGNNNQDDTFVKTLNTNNNLIVFDNGVFDLKNNEFRNGNVNDNMSMSVGYNYISCHSKKMVELEKFLSDIQPNKEERDFLLTYLSTALHSNKFEWFTILTGEGRNGKTKFIDLIKKTFGEFYGSVKSQLFTRPQPDANSPDPGLLSLRNKKIVISVEPEKKSKLNSGFIKFITGRDSVQLRECHKNEMIDFNPKFVTLFVCNDIPDTDEIDNAFSKRLKCINFPTEFCDDPKKHNQKLIDTEIDQKFDGWRSDFMLLLIEYYQKYSITKRIITTDSIMKWTNKYKEYTDIYLSFLNECTEMSNTHLRTSALYEAFKKWYIINNPNINVPSNRTFTMNVKKHKTIELIRFGKSITNGLKNMKIKNEYE